MTALAAIKHEWGAIVIGAGPAGLAAATMLARSDVDVLVVDEQADPGGQIYRGIERAAARNSAAALGPDYMRGIDLVAAFRASGASYLPQATVWRVTRDRRIYISAGGVSAVLQAKAVIVATGAIERPVPVPGWTLPGVMTAGALQILLKTSALVPVNPVIVAGTGPLFYLLVQQLRIAGAKLAAVLDTQQPMSLFTALPWLPTGLTGEGIGYLFKGIKLKRSARQENFFTGISDIRIEGKDRVEAVSFVARGNAMRLSATVVALHEGVIPGQQMTRSIDCAHRWDSAQRAFHPVCDAWGNTSVPGILAAGDVARVAGARAAEHSGRLAALEVMHMLGKIDAATRDQSADFDRRQLARHVSVRPFLDRLFTPRDAVLRPQDDVVVCRCEEIAAGAVRGLAADGLGPNQIKSFLRCGMGPCQGRLCGPVVSEIVAAERGCPLDDAGYYNVRTPLRPLTLGELAGLHEGD